MREFLAFIIFMAVILAISDGLSLQVNDTTYRIKIGSFKEEKKEQPKPAEEPKRTDGPKEN